MNIKINRESKDTTLGSVPPAPNEIRAKYILETTTKTRVTAINKIFGATQRLVLKGTSSPIPAAPIAVAINNSSP